MPSVNSVRPAIWDKESVIDLYDNGTYSAVWGSREKSHVVWRPLER